MVHWRPMWKMVPRQVVPPSSPSVWQLRTLFLLPAKSHQHTRTHNNKKRGIIYIFLLNLGLDFQQIAASVCVCVCQLCLSTTPLAAHFEWQFVSRPSQSWPVLSTYSSRPKKNLPWEKGKTGRKLFISTITQSNLDSNFFLYVLSDLIQNILSSFSCLFAIGWRWPLRKWQFPVRQFVRLHTSAELLR